MKRDWISRETTVEVIVGSFIVMVLLGLAYFTIILSRETWFGTKFRMDVHFTDVMGLRDGDSVVARGMQVGKVKAMMLDTNQSGVKVVLTLDKQLQMRTDYRIQIETTSILGGRHMLIHEGAADHPMLPADALIRGQDPFNIMSDAAEIINEIVPRFTALQVYQAILESSASEHAARMVAMKNATDSAVELVSALQLEYNKARQQTITNEMLDIAGGAEALVKAGG